MSQEYSPSVPSNQRAYFDTDRPVNRPSKKRRYDEAETIGVAVATKLNDSHMSTAEVNQIVRDVISASRETIANRGNSGIEDDDSDILSAGHRFKSSSDVETSDEDKMIKNRRKRLIKRKAEIAKQESFATQLLSLIHI